MGKKALMLFLCCAIGLGIWLAGKPETAYACSCAPPPEVKVDLGRKAAVFSGTVKSVEKPKSARSSADAVKITFQVKTVWKGELRSEEVVYTALSSASCGYENFMVNQEYMVFAHGSAERLQTGICERTKPLSQAGEELAALGTGYQPRVPLWYGDGQTAPRESSSPGQVDRGSALAVAVLGGVMVAAAVVFAILRKRYR